MRHNLPGQRISLSPLLPPFLVLKLQQEVASGEDRGGKKQGGNDRGTLGRGTEAERWRERERRGGGRDRQRRAEKGRKMKGNLIDEKEEQEKGVAVRERSTLETKKCRARPSERHAGISGASFDEGKLVITPARLTGAQVMTSDEVITRGVKWQPFKHH